MTDEELLAQLGAVARVLDPPPDLAYEIGQSAFAWRVADAELAQLVADSAMEDAVVRSADPATRLLSFESDALTIEMQVSDRGGKQAVIGQLIPEPAPAEATIRVESTKYPVVEAAVDPGGRFAVDDVPRDLVRLRVESPGIRSVTSQWVQLGPREEQA